MGIYTTRPIQEISSAEFKYLIEDKSIEISTHALFHLSEKQRKIFNKQELIGIIRRETPRKVYLQENGRYSVYYRKSDGYRKIIIELGEKAVVVSFMDLKEIPRYEL